MNTNDAIATLLALKHTIDSQISGYQAQSDALGVALAQLQGTLKTELDTIATLTEKLATDEEIIAKDEAALAQSTQPNETPA